MIKYSCDKFLADFSIGQSGLSKKGTAKHLLNHEYCITIFSDLGGFLKLHNFQNSSIACLE